MKGMSDLAVADRDHPRREVGPRGGITAGSRGWIVEGEPARPASKSLEGRKMGGLGRREKRGVKKARRTTESNPTNISRNMEVAGPLTELSAWGHRIEWGGGVGG